MQTLTKGQMTKLHDASMDILENTGVVFNESEALKIFKKNGFKVDGKTVFFTEKDLTKALESAPARFKVTARNPEKSVIIGGDDFVFVPAYGAPFITASNGEQRKATMQDYENFCKLVQTSKYIDMNGIVMVEPSDVPSETAYLDMLFSNIVLCDKAFMGSTHSKKSACDTIEMAGIVWGNKKKIKEMPVTVSLINVLTPLQFSEEMAGALIELARYSQPCVVANMVMAGASGPISLPGVLALLNAEILAGLTLAQLVGPGTPIIYGSTSTPIDMKSAAGATGAPEVPMLVSATAQMAQFYNLPSRSGGGLTDAHFPDAQAGIEAALTLYTAARNGINFILNSCGHLGSHMSMSYEKFIMDEELCGMIRHLLKRMEITDENIDVEEIKSVGIGGQYLTLPKTVKLCRTGFFMTDLMNRKNYQAWSKAGSKRIDEVSSDLLARRLASYEKPETDPAIENALSEYVTKRKNG